MTENDYEKRIEIGIGLVTLFVWPFVIRWLWNLLAVPIVGVQSISYWQAFGLHVLVAFLSPPRTSLWTIQRKLRRILHEKID